MAHVVVLGAGLGGVMMACEMQDQLGKGDRVTVVTRGHSDSFVPSNPWVAVGWRDRDDNEVDLRPVMDRRGIALRPEGAARVHPAEGRTLLRTPRAAGARHRQTQGHSHRIRG